MKKWLIIVIAAIWAGVGGMKLVEMRAERAAQRVAIPAATPDPTLGVELGSALPHRSIAATNAKFGAAERERKVKRVPRERTPVTFERRAGWSQAATTETQGAEQPAMAAEEIAGQARAALALVGTGDEEAEAFWMAAINNPELDEEMRSDLIEDLNEEGFGDEDNITQAELPIVQRRMRLIQSLAPSAMDQTNAAAFQEAYRDLANIYNRLTGSEISTEIPQ